MYARLSFAQGGTSGRRSPPEVLPRALFYPMRYCHHAAERGRAPAVCLAYRPDACKGAPDAKPRR